MAYALIGLYGVYFILAGVKGNAGALLTAVEQDGKGFMPWLLAIIVLRALYAVQSLRPLIKPFIVLACLTFALKNYSTIVSQLNQLLPSNAQIPTGAQ